MRLKNNILFIFTLFLVMGCNRDKAIPVLSNEVFLKDTYDSTITTIQLLDKYLPYILTNIDTSNCYYGNNRIEDDTMWRNMLVGKLIDDKHIVAIEVNFRDTAIRFYELKKSKWSLIGQAKTNINVYLIMLEDLNGDGVKEIVTSTSYNMNGNMWMEAYIYSNKSNGIRYSGAFSTGYEIDTSRKQIQETYTGSWYMNESKTLYEWRDEKLVPIKQIVFNKEHINMQGGNVLFEYYENSSNDIDALKLKYSEPFINQHRQDSIWDNFFEYK